MLEFESSLEVDEFAIAHAKSTPAPVRPAAWMLEKFWAWSDCGGDVERSSSRDQLLDAISLYWLTGTIGSSMRIYFEDHGPRRSTPLPLVAVATGHAVFPGEILRTPRAWAQKRFNSQRWRLMPRGGHSLQWKNRNCSLMKFARSSTAIVRREIALHRR